MDLSFSRCPVCGKEFLPGEDVVTCPDCGTPHHRECYNKLGHCANAHRHGEGFVWQPERPAGEPEAPGRQCAVCGSPLDPDAQYCNACGSPAIDTELDGIPAKEWAAYLGPEAPGYLTAVKNQDLRHKKLTLYLPLFFFPPIFLLRRRMWLETVAYELVGLLLSVPMFVYMFLPQVTLFGLSEAAFGTLVSIMSYLSIIYRVFWALYGVWLYRQSARRRILRLRQRIQDPEQRLSALAAYRPTWVPVVIYAGVYIVCLVMAGI